MSTFRDTPTQNGNHASDAPVTEDAITAQASVSDTDGSTTAVKATVSGRPFEWLGSVASSFGAITGAIAGTVAFVYLVGGAIMWIRFMSADLPADQAVSLVPRNDLMVIGLRVMVLPALLAGVFFFVLARRERRRTTCAPRRIRLRPSLAWIVAIVGSGLVVPFTPGAVAWPIAAFVLWLVWHHCLASACHASTDKAFPLWQAAILAALLAAVVSLARQFDHPIQLASATVQVGDGPKQIGVLVSESTDQVSVGFSKARSIRVFSRAQLNSLVVGPALDAQAPARSLLSRLLRKQPPWAATPLEIWCGGEHYQLWQIGKLCKTHPEIVGGKTSVRNGILRMQLRCPSAASRGCSGFLRVLTADPLAVHALDRRARVIVGKADFQISAGKPLEVLLPLDPRISRVLAALDRDPVPLNAVISLDRGGDAIIAQREVSAHFPAPKRAKRVNRGAGPDRDHHGPAGNTGHPSHTRPSQTQAEAETTPTPGPTATATPTPVPLEEDPSQTAPAERITPDAPIELPPADVGPAS